MNKKVIPAISSIKNLEKFITSPYEIGVLLDSHIAQLKNINDLAEKYGKKLMFHMDLIEGIKNDEKGTEFICQEFRPYGLISTKANVIRKAKQKGVLSIQRMFLIDSHAVEQSYRHIKMTDPDYIEVLPGTLPSMIREVAEKTNIPILAGGLIRKPEEVEKAIAAGATAVTTSAKHLWDIYEKIQ